MTASLRPAFAIAATATLGAVATLAVMLAFAGAAEAQGPAYVAEPPTPGALYSDGQTGRYLLGGSWLYRADPTDIGLSLGWFGNLAATDGWTPVTVPNPTTPGTSPARA